MLEADDLIVFSAFILALLVTLYRFDRRGFSISALLIHLPLLALFALAGARLYHVFTPSLSMVARGWTTHYYLTHPLEIVLFSQGGFGALGGWLGLWAGLAWLAWRDKRGWGALAAASTPGILIGLAVGRWADWPNQALYGPPTGEGWGLMIDPANRLPAYATVERFHPLFLYESIVIIAWLALWLYLERRIGLSERARGILGLGGYAFARFFLSFLRVDKSMAYEIDINQLISLMLFALGMMVVLGDYFRKRKQRSSSA
jgi:phosphatidylglycerol:prolipoprotein diacylglycerol transferase